MSATDNPTPLVTVIVPCYNAASWLRETLDSVQAQGVALETIVVDDGSTDDSAAIVEAEYPWVRLIRSQNNGASHARNLAIPLARGRFIQFLDADDLLPPGKLELQAKALETQDAGVAYGDWEYLVQGPDGQFVSGERFSRIIGDDAQLALFSDTWFPLHVYLFRSEIVQRVGAFRLDLPIIQDARFTLEVAIQGATFVYTPGFSAPYRMHSTTQNSRRDPAQFRRDVFNNTQQVHRIWQDRGTLTPAREQALLDSYFFVARASYRRDSTDFEAALQSIEALRPSAIPRTPRHLGWLSRVVGYRRAEAIAFRYRQAKALGERAIPRAVRMGATASPPIQAR